MAVQWQSSTELLLQQPNKIVSLSAPSMYSHTAASEPRHHLAVSTAVAILLAASALSHMRGLVSSSTTCRLFSFLVLYETTREPVVIVFDEKII